MSRVGVGPLGVLVADGAGVAGSPPLLMPLVTPLELPPAALLPLLVLPPPKLL